MHLFIVVVVPAVFGLGLWIGKRYGNAVLFGALDEEKKISSALRSAVGSLVTEKTKADGILRSKAAQLLLDAKRIAPWLAVLLAVGLFMSACAGEPAFAQAQFRHHSGYALNDVSVTPGSVDATLVADLTRAPHMVNVLVHGKMVAVEHNICAPDFRTEPFRLATKSESIKKAVCAAYGITSGCPGPAWELDDVCSIETGCKNVRENLWPQPIDQARFKDHHVEDRLGGPKGLICQGKISLADVQNGLKSDWYAFGVEHGLISSK